MSGGTFRDWSQHDVDRLNAKTSPKPIAVVGAPAEPDYVEGAEVESLHIPFKRWLEYHRISYVYSRSDRATTNERGQFDFVTFYHGNVCSIEFKCHHEPETKLRKAQRDWWDEQKAAKNPSFVCNSVQQACHLVAAVFDLKL